MKRFITAALCCAAVAAAGASAGAETFKGALSTALTNSPEVLAQREVLKQLDEAVEFAKAGWRPTIAATGSVGYTASDGPTGSTDTIPASVGASISQPVYDGFQTRNAVAAAEANVAAGRYALLAVEQDILLAAAEAYVAVLQAEENVRLARNNIEVISRQLDATEARLEVGEVTRTDVAQARAALAQSRANLRVREGQLRNAREDFERIVGIPAGSLSPLPPLPVLPGSLAEAEDIALQRNPTFLSSIAALDAAVFGVEQARGALLPQVSVSGSTSLSSTRLFGPGGEAGTLAGEATLSVSVPIYTAGTLRSAVRSNSAIEAQRVYERDQARRQLLRDIGVTWEDLLTARATIVANAEQVDAERIAFEGVREEARVGSRTVLDVLDAEQELLDARIALVNSRSDEQVAAYRLLAQMGVLTIETLGLDVERYNPDEPQASISVGAVQEAGGDDSDWMQRY